MAARLPFLVITAVLTVFLSCSTLAEPLEHIVELGVGAGGQVLPKYRGHDDHNTIVLPFPYVGYQGKIIESDKDGVRGKFFKSPRIELNISGDLALSDADDQPQIRDGMPELGTEFQIGPTLNFLLAGDNFESGWMLRLPVRGVFVFEDDYSSVSSQGAIFNPMVTFIKPNLFDSNWRFSADMGALYASESYHNYYYTVAPQYATLERPEFQAEAGFSGTFFEVGLSSSHKNWLYSVSVRYDNLKNATFHDSPLVETDDYVAFGFGLIYVFKEWRIKEPAKKSE